MLSASCRHAQRPRLLLLEHSMQRDILLPSKKPVYQQYKKCLCRSARRYAWRQQTAGLRRRLLFPQDMTPLLPHTGLTLSDDAAFFGHTFS